MRQSTSRKARSVRARESHRAAGLPKPGASFAKWACAFVAVFGVAALLAVTAAELAAQAQVQAQAQAPAQAQVPAQAQAQVPAQAQAQVPAQAPAQAKAQARNLAPAEIGFDEAELFAAFPPAPREKKQMLARAREALDEKRNSDAVEYLGRILVGEDDETEDERAQDYFIPVPDGTGQWSSLKTEARRMLGSMPKDGRDIYELQYGARARRMLDDALGSGDAKSLNDVARLYFHTQAGYEAAVLAGRYNLDQGRPLAAALSFERVAETPAAGQFEPELSLLLATSWLYADLPRKADAALRSLKRRMPDTTIRVGATQTGLFGEQQDAVAWLEGIVGPRRSRTPLAASDWLMHRGGPNRNVPSSGGVPLANYRWRLPTVNDPSDETLVRQLTAQMNDQGVAALPSLHVLAVGDTVVMRTSKRLMGVDFATGKRVWEFPYFDLGDATTHGETAVDTAANAAALRAGELAQRMWEDAPYGQMSSDGDSVFLLDDMGYAAFDSRNVVVVGGRIIPNPNAPRSYNQLVACNLRREGALRWKIGGATGEDEPKLAGAFFLGAPLPHQGELYVLAEMNNEIRLVVLDAKSGRLEWSQQLALVETNPIEVDSARRLAGASPSLADGVLVCPTSNGAVVGVDLATRTLLWGFSYPRHGDAGNVSRARRVRAIRTGQPLGSRWIDATVTIAEGKVILTPVESDETYCLDLLTGRPVWLPGQKRNNLLYLASVKDGVAVYVGSDTVAGRRLDDFAPAWPEDVKLPAPPSGRGFASGDHYYVPTSDARLVQLNVREGRIERVVPTGRVLGNLVCHNGQVLAQGADWLLALYQAQPLWAVVEARLDKNPDDAWALTRRAELLLQEGRRDEALANLRRARALEPDDDSIRALLVDSMMQALHDDFAAHQHLATELEPLIERPSQRTKFLALVASRLEQAGQFDAAFDTWLKLAELEVELNSDVASEAAGPILDRFEPHLRVRVDRWVSVQGPRLLQHVGMPRRDRLDRLVAARLETALSIDTPRALRALVETFGFHPLADRARLRLAAKLEDAGEWLEAEQLLIPLVAASEPAIAGPATVQLARVYENAKLFGDAAALYRRLAERWPDTVCFDDMTGTQVVESLAANSAVSARLAPVAPWPAGEVVIREGAGETAPVLPSRSVFRVELRQASGPLPIGAQATLDPQRYFALYDGRGARVARVALAQAVDSRNYVQNYRLAHARGHGHVLVLSLGFECVAVDALRAAAGLDDAVLWRHELATALPETPANRAIRRRVQPRKVSNAWGESRYVATDSQGQRVGETGPLLSTGLCLLSGRELVCIDPISGETIWSRDDVPADAELFGDDEFLFVMGEGSGEVVVVSPLDGRLLGTRLLPMDEERWTTHGRRVLTWSQQNDEMRLRLYDVWAQRDVWVRNYPVGTRGTLVEQDEVATLRPDGSCEILSLEEDRPTLATQLEPEPSLESIVVLRSADRYLLMTSEPIVREAADLRIEAAPGGYHAPLVNGRLYALDRSTGDPTWPAPAVVSQFGLPLDQPRESPFALFLRHITTTGGRAPRATRTSVVALDKRDGRVVFQRDDIPTTTGAYALLAEPHHQSVTLLLPGKAYTMDLTDQPAPPSPPAHVGNPDDLPPELRGSAE